MLKNNLLLFIGVFAILATSCRTNYEQIRTSNDPELILKTANEYYDNEDYFKAQGLYDIVIPFYRGKSEAQELFYRYAYTYFNTDEYILASHYFGSFAKTFYDSPKKEESEFMEAYSQYKLSPNHRLDQSYSQKAIEAFQQFANAHPLSPRVEQCNMLIDEMREKMEIKALDQGKLYIKLHQYQAATKSLENMLKDFPETSRGAEIRYLIIKSNFNLATKSIFTKQQERFEETIRKINQFKKKYSSSNYLAEIERIEKNCLTELKEISNVRLAQQSTRN